MRTLEKGEGEKKGSMAGFSAHLAVGSLRVARRSCGAPLIPRWYLAEQGALASRFVTVVYHPSSGIWGRDGLRWADGGERGGEGGEDIANKYREQQRVN